MFLRGKSTSLAKPKKLHSLDYLKYLCSVLQKHSTVTDQNTAIIVEVFRLIAEILIWGDQNDSSVMDYFLEMNMLEHLMKYLKQNTGRMLCVQLLQTLNILFENITNKTAIYYLLSNSHTNEIITHRFDFADEEVVAYYISFLKTLSLRLNPETINFFYFEAQQEFDLYVECIKLFCHPENMVRIAVRTITLNVHKVKDVGALEFIHRQTALPYFSFLVWSIGNTILDIDALLHSDFSTQNLLRLEDLVAEHLDHLHYLNDLLSLGIEAINEVLCDLLLHRLLIPLHVYSLTKRYNSDAHKNTGARRPHVTLPVAAFMLTHIFIIIKHVDLVRVLAEAIFMGDLGLINLSFSHLNSTKNVGLPDSKPVETESSDDDLSRGSSEEVDPAVTIAQALVDSATAIRQSRSASAGHRLEAYMECTCKKDRHPAFLQPKDSLAVSLRKAKGVTRKLIQDIWPAGLSPLRLISNENEAMDPVSISDGNVPQYFESPVNFDLPSQSSPELGSPETASSSEVVCDLPTALDHLSSVGSTLTLRITPPSPKSDPLKDDTATLSASFELQGFPFLRALYRALEVGPGTDYDAVFALLLLSSIRTNKGLDQDTLRLFGLDGPDPTKCPAYDHLLVGKLLALITDACKSGSRVRLVTLHLAMRLLAELVCDSAQRCHLSDEHFAVLVAAREEAMMVLRSYFQNDAIFLDLFESELRQMQKPFAPLHKLALDSRLLIPPLAAAVLSNSPGKTSKPHRDYRCHLPQSDVEHTQRAAHVYLLVHIGLESLLRARPHETIDDVPLEVGVEIDSAEPMFSAKLPVDLASVYGLAGLDSIPDARTVMASHKAGDKLDLSSEVLVGCTVETHGSHEKRFLVNFSQHLVLVEPDSKQMGWGVITFIGPLQDLEATCDPTDSRCLHVTINPPGHLTATTRSSSASANRHSVSVNSKCLLCARFLFEDHIRCMTARQMLLRGRELARQTKLRKIAILLDFSQQYIRDNFVYGNRFRGNPGSSTGVHNRASVHPVSTDANSPIDETRDTIQPSRMCRHPAAPNPGTFLMERQTNRLKQQKLDKKPDLPELTPPPHVSLATLARSAPHLHHRHSAPPVKKDFPAPQSSRTLELTNLTPVTLVQQQLPATRKTPKFSVTNASKTSNDHSAVKRLDQSSTTVSDQIDRTVK